MDAGSGGVGRDGGADLTDSYVVISLGSEMAQETRFRTKTVYDNLNPTYNETFTFHLVTPLGDESVLVVQCVDDDIVVNEFVGEVRIRLRRLPIHRDVDDWYPLLDSRCRKSGEIRLRIVFTGADESQEDEGVVDMAAAAHSNPAPHYSVTGDSSSTMIQTSKVAGPSTNPPPQPIAAEGGKAA